MATPFAASASNIVLVTVAALSVIALVLIVVAPWRRVRDEPPLDRDVETRLLLHRPHPEEATGEIPAAGVADLNDRSAAPGAGTPGGSGTEDFTTLRDLDTD
jgi:hypothetical protein